MTTTGQSNDEMASPLAEGEGAGRRLRRQKLPLTNVTSFASQTRALAAARELADQVRQAQCIIWDPDFPENGSFSRVQKRSPSGVPRAHWYFDCYKPAGRKQGTGRGVRRYIGTAGDAGVEARIQAFNSVKNSRALFAERVAALSSSGLPSPPRFIGRLINAMARAGVFRDGGVLLGTPAYQTYDVILGVALVQAPGTHGELGARNIRSISTAVRTFDSARVLGELARVDPTFEILETGAGWQFVNRAGYRVNATRMQGSSAASRMSSFLAEEPIDALVLSGSGISVRVPNPIRFALAKCLQLSHSKSTASAGTKRKNRIQAEQIIGLLVSDRNEPAIVRACDDAERISLLLGTASPSALGPGAALRRPC